MQVNYPDKKPKINTSHSREEVFCMIRKKWVVLTPEEWVRQNFLLYLTETMKFPSSLIAVEKQLVIAAVKKRFDIIVYDSQTKPLILVECKEMHHNLTATVLHQALNYFKEIQSRYLIITNGKHTIAYEKREDGFFETDKIVQTG